MNFKKAATIAAAAGALAAVSVPAMAFENEFHGMYRAFGYMTNALSGAGGFNLANGSGTDKFMEQRARLQYIAKASDDLKLVTHFELDTKFGGANTSGKYVPGNGDGGGLDADKLSLETKSVYLDFKIPSTPVRAQVGVQPYNDSFGGLFGNFDATGAVFTAKFDALTASYGYFTVGQAAVTGVGFDAFKKGTNNTAQDLNAIDLKFAISKDLSLGASYYMLLDKTGDSQSATVANNTVGLNAAGKIGPVSLTGALGMQFGKSNPGFTPSGSLSSAATASANGTFPVTAAGVSATSGSEPGLNNQGTIGLAAALAAKIAVGPGNVNLAALYLSGDADGTGYNHAWQPIGSGVTYYSPANMWLLTRNAATINSSTAIGGSSDITRGGRGIKGIFAGYEGSADKIFYSGNVGYAAVDKKQTANSSSIGTELNATVGYKLYANLSASVTAAYAILGDGFGAENATLLQGAATTAKSYDNPFLTAVQLNYTF
jgi:hypothetical protein